MKFTLDNHDSRIPYYKLRLHRTDLNNIPEAQLPEGYHFEFYQFGDRDAWIEIETTSKECGSVDDALYAWNTYFAPWEDQLSKRMLFVVNSQGKKVATASAYFDVHGLDPSDSGRLHWVAVHRQYQGKGLSRALLSETMKLMSGMDVTHAFCNTSSRNWVACRLYLDLGFVPFQMDDSIDGWRLIKTLTNHPVLNDLDSVDMTEWIK